MGIFSADKNELESSYRDIDNCASCGEDHQNILIKELVVPIIIDGNEFDGMYYCTETGDSIYIQMKEL